MGLDMYTYKIRRPSDAEAKAIAGKKAHDVHERYSLIRLAELDEDGLDLVSDLRPYSQTVKLIAQLVDYDKLKRDFEIPEDAEIVGWGNHSGLISYHFSAANDYSKQVQLSVEELESGFGYEELNEYLMFESTVVACWRKDYDLQEAIHDACERPIGNCGFYRCSDVMLRVMDQYNAFPDGVPECAEEEALFYYEWY